MAISKVVYGADTLVDLTGDTVTPDDVAEGVVFHSADGTQQIGTRSSAPAAHASSHATGGSDPITPTAIGAAAATEKQNFAFASGRPARIQLTLSDNTEYRFSSALDMLTLFFPSSEFECWLKFETSSEFSINLPSGATYLGGKPTFEPGKTYEMSIKDGCVICAEVVSA